MSDHFDRIVKSQVRKQAEKHVGDKMDSVEINHDRGRIIQLWQDIFRDYPRPQPTNISSKPRPSRPRKARLINDEIGPIDLDCLDEWRKGYASRIEKFVGFVKKSRFRAFLKHFPFFNMNEALCVELLLASQRTRFELLKKLPIEKGKFLDWHHVFKHSFTPGFSNWLESCRWLNAETWYQRCDAYDRCCWEADRCATESAYIESGFRHCNHMFELLKTKSIKPQNSEPIKFSRPTTCSPIQIDEISEFNAEFLALSFFLTPQERRMVIAWVAKHCPTRTIPPVNNPTFIALCNTYRFAMHVHEEQNPQIAETKKAYKWPDEYERDAWIYKNFDCQSYEDLKNNLKSMAPKKRWTLISSRNSLKKFADRFAEFHVLEKKRFKRGNSSRTQK